MARLKMHVLLAGIVVFAGAAWQEPAQPDLATLKGHVARWAYEHS